MQYQDGHDCRGSPGRVYERAPAGSQAQRDSLPVLHREEVHGDHPVVRAGPGERQEELSTRERFSLKKNNLKIVKIVCCFLRANKQARPDRLHALGRERPGNPRPTGHLPGHGPAPGALLRQLQSQYLPDRQAVRRKVQRRNIQTGGTQFSSGNFLSLRSTDTFSTCPQLVTTSHTWSQN